MRQELSKLDGLRKTFRGTFERFGSKTNFKGYPETTILFKDIKCVADNKAYCDHVWFSMTKPFEKIELQEGDTVQFDARVKEYYKGYKGYREELQEERPIEKDYKLSHPTKVMLVRRIKNDV